MGQALPAFVLARTEVQSLRALPQVRLRVAGDPIGLWEDAEEALGRQALDPPFWASAWPGGLALASYLLQHPETVQGRAVVDVASGSGVVAIAAALAGARCVAAYDTDDLAVRVIEMNAQLNTVRVDSHKADVREVTVAAGTLVTAGDVFYARDISSAMLDGLGTLADAGAEVLVGDPYRSFLPRDRLHPLATFDLDVDAALESEPVKTTLVARLTPRL